MDLISPAMAALTSELTPISLRETAPTNTPAGNPTCLEKISEMDEVILRFNWNSVSISIELVFSFARLLTITGDSTDTTPLGRGRARMRSDSSSVELSRDEVVPDWIGPARKASVCISDVKA